MKTFSEILKEIRLQSGLNQVEFGKKIGVSTVLVSKLERECRRPSTEFIKKLACALGVHPASIAPFAFISEQKPTRAEKLLIDFGESMQDILIKKKSKNLKNS